MAIIIIAEAGVNHNGSLEIAKDLAMAAKMAGADYVKYQSFNPQKLVARYAQKAAYQKESTNVQESQLEMLEKLALSHSDFKEIKAYCECIGIGFLSTPFDFENIDFLTELGVPFWKVPSGEITNLPYLTRLARSGKPVFMSTGMCELDEVKSALDVMQENGAGPITLLHCNTEYPTPFEDVNLRAMHTMKEEFSLPVGYSDHTPGTEVAIAAAALGAVVIEKHFTLDRNMEGPDHKASLEPNELKYMIGAIRNVEAAIGSGEKKCSPSEGKNRDVARKSIVAAQAIQEGEFFTEENLTVKRPGNGISPMRWYEVLGKQAKRNFAEDELIEL